MQTLLDEIVAQVSQVRGVRAAALGGSRARGTHSATSDIDLGIYYDDPQAFDLEALGALATRLDDERRVNLITPIGGWGPWINGGGWLKVRSLAVDFLYRDLRQVQRVMNDCCAGRVDVFYQPGHPLGFVSAMYMSETAVCRVLWEDAERPLTHLKARTVPYPAALKQALIERFAWEIGFSLGIAHKGAGRSDTSYVAGCCFRAAMCMLQVLFALNEVYWLNEKGAAAIADGFRLRPANLNARLDEAFAGLSAEPAALEGAIAALAGLEQEVQALIAQAG